MLALSFHVERRGIKFMCVSKKGKKEIADAIVNEVRWCDHVSACSQDVLMGQYAELNIFHFERGDAACHYNIAYYRSYISGSCNQISDVFNGNGLPRKILTIELNDVFDQRLR